MAGIVSEGVTRAVDYASSTYGLQLPEAAVYDVVMPVTLCGPEEDCAPLYSAVTLNRPVNSVLYR